MSLRPPTRGKSTWSAFLRAMLYGINTKERDRQGYLAEKNRYQPLERRGHGGERGAALAGAVRHPPPGAQGEHPLWPL